MCPLSCLRVGVRACPLINRFFYALPELGGEGGGWLKTNYTILFFWCLTFQHLEIYFLIFSGELKECNLDICFWTMCAVKRMYIYNWKPWRISRTLEKKGELFFKVKVLSAIWMFSHFYIYIYLYLYINRRNYFSTFLLFILGFAHKSNDVVSAKLIFPQFLCALKVFIGMTL